MGLCCNVLGNLWKNQTDNPSNLCIIPECSVDSKFGLKTDSVTVVYRVFVFVAKAYHPPQARLHLIRKGRVV